MTTEARYVRVDFAGAMWFTDEADAKRQIEGALHGLGPEGNEAIVADISPIQLTVLDDPNPYESLVR